MTSRLEDYDVLSIIGTGSFGTCYKVKKKSSGHLYVWKAISYRGMSEEKKQLLVSEVNLLSELRHPNIVQYNDRIIHKESATLYIVMEWCEGGDLSSLINKCRKSSSFLDEGFVWRVLYQMCRALQACHWHLCKVTVLHRDIKPANVFLDGSGNVKLGDFGLARVLHDDVSYAQTMVGTPYYMSPEVIKGGKYNKKSDIWSLGCLIFELCTLSPPFTGSNIKLLALKIKEGKFPRIPPHYSDDLQKIISLLLTVDHSLRPAAEAIVHHPTVVMHIAHETIKSSIADSNSDCKKMSDEDLTNVEEELKNCHLPQNENNVLKDNGNLKLLSNEKIRDIWLNRIQTLKQREISLRLRELTVDERERSVVKREKQIALLDRLTKDKMTRADIYLRQCREVRSVASSIKNANHQQNIAVVDDLDTTVSADPGDTSILPTSTKLKPEFVPKPSSFTRVGSGRRVHFDTLPFTKSKTKQSRNIESIGENQHTVYKEQHGLVRIPNSILYDIPEYMPSHINKVQDNGVRSAFQDMEKIEQDNYRNGVLASLTSNQLENRNKNVMERPWSRDMSWKEERKIWLENKRQAYHMFGSVKTHKSSNKENTADPSQQKVIKSTRTSTTTVSSVPESGLGSLLSFR